MAEAIRLTKRCVEALPPVEKEAFVWDADLAGFGLRIWPSGRRVFVVQYRVHGGRGGKQRRLTIGAYPLLTVDQARKKAHEALAMARLGTDAADARDKARQAETVGDLVNLWLDEAAHVHRRTGATRSERNIAFDRGRLNAHVRPLLGSRRLSELDRKALERFRDQVARGAHASETKTKKRGVARVTGGDGAAARTMRLLSSVLAFGVDRDLLAENPATGVRVAPGKSMNRFLTGDELQRLGAALKAAEKAGAHPHGLAIIRLLALTGARRNEIESLRWSEVDFVRGLLRLETSKTGAKIIPLAPAALTILQALPRHAGRAEVFPATRGATGHYKGLGKVWTDVRAAADLDGVRLHDLRHTFASFGAGGGFGLPVIGGLLGHKQASTTQRYAHLADDPLKVAAGRIGGAVAAAMKGKAA